MLVEWVSGSAWNHCPDVRGMGVRVSVESASNLASAKMPLEQNAMAARRDAAVEPNGYTQEAE